jgi:hypothetical protein
MKTTNFSPDESFEIIESVINKPKLVLKKMDSPLFFGGSLYPFAALVKLI